MINVRIARFFGLLAVAVGLNVAQAPKAAAGERMDKIIASQTLKLGFRSDAPPFSFENEGSASGFTVELCVAIGALMKESLGLNEFNGELVRVETTDRFDAIARGDADLLCGATTATLTRREQVGFSLSTFHTGVGSVVSASASDLLREVLITSGPAAGSPAATKQAMSGKKIGVHKGTTAADWLAKGNMAELTGVPVTEFNDHAAGIQMVADGELDAYFADQAILIGNVLQSGLKDKVLVSKQSYTNEPYAIALPKGDEELRLEVDKAISQIYRSGQILEFVSRHFGKPTPEMAFFYAMTALPE